MSQAIPFENIILGEELGPWDIVVTEEVVSDYCRDWDDHNPLYSTPPPDGGAPYAPPAFMAGLTCFRLLGSRYNAAATVGAQTEHENIRPLRVGQTLSTRSRIVEKYVKRRLEYVVIESTSSNDAGEPVRRSRDHILLSLERVPGPDTRITA